MASPMRRPVDWRAPTLRDHLLAQQAARTAAGLAADLGADGTAAGPARRIPRAEDPNHSQRCPACQRIRWPDLIRDVRMLPLALRKRGAAFLCDACCAELFARDLIDRVECARLLGAPPAWLAWLEAKLEQSPLRTGLPDRVRAKLGLPDVSARRV